MKKLLSMLLVVAMMTSLLAGCGQKVEPTVAAPETTAAPVETVPPTTAAPETTQAPEELPRLMVMSGPTGVGAAKLLKDGEGTVIASGEVVEDNESVKNALVSGEVDIAAIATNMAATLNNKLGGGLQVLAVNTLGVLYILEKGDTVASMADLKGKTLYATGQGANPEYVLNYLLTQNGVEPADVNIEWLTGQEIIAKMASGESGICMLPVPAATTLMMKDENVRQALSLSEEWDKLGNGALTQGCIVARTEYVEQNPNAVEAFLAAYEDSISYMNDETARADAAALVAEFGITANAKIAMKAIPQCNLVCVRGQEMKDMLIGFYDVLFQAAPASVGGAMPADGFYYGVG